MKETLCTAFGLTGACFTYFIGGADTIIKVLGIIMAVDYITGLLIAVVFHKSPKTMTGGANSMVGFKGICKKFVMICIVGVANQLDIALGMDIIRAGVGYAFMANETISVIENAGIMGIPVPPILTKAIDILNKKEETND